MTKTLNQIFFISSTKVRIFFSATLGIRIFFLEKNHNLPPPSPLQVKWSFPSWFWKCSHSGIFCSSHYRLKTRFVSTLHVIPSWAFCWCLCFLVVYLFIVFERDRLAQWDRWLDYLATPPPVRRGFAPGFVNYIKRCTRFAAISDIWPYQHPTYNGLER